MTLIITLGQTVVAQIDGHSSVNGALIPDGSTIAMASNDPTVATVPASIPVPAGGTESIPGIAVTVLTTGSTDITADVTDAAGNVFHAAATLVVNPTPIPGLVSISLTLATM